MKNVYIFWNENVCFLTAQEQGVWLCLNVQRGGSGSGSGGKRPGLQLCLSFNYQWTESHFENSFLDKTFVTTNIDLIAFKEEG